MDIKLVKENKSYAIKITASEDGAMLGSAYLYIMYNDLHKEPFGFLENVFVEEGNRGKGTGTKLVLAAIEEARKQKCYKLICTSRREKIDLHRWYEKLGFRDHGKEFRIDF